MATFTVPKLQQLDRAQFPKDAPWADYLVNTINQFTIEVVQALQTTLTRYKTLTFTTGSSVAAVFPFDFPIDITPKNVQVAQVISGATSILSPNTVHWTILSNGNIRVIDITGLSAQQSYSIRLVVES